MLEYDFDLPENRIAREPARPRDQSKLMVCRSNGRLGDFSGAFEIRDFLFRDLAEILTPNDVLVMNDAKVLPVRLLGNRLSEDGTKGGAVELVLTTPRTDTEWSAILHLSAKVRPGMKLVFEPGLIAEIHSTHEERLQNAGEVRVSFSGFAPETSFEAWLTRYGHIPLPPYIDRPDTEQDKLDYQTVYARKIGSAAAPTAGLHFTEELLALLKEKGIEIEKLTLHVGIGTFRPIKSSKIEDHVMHEETFEISANFAQRFQAHRQAGKRIVAVGTTVVRALESWDGVSDGIFKTRILISPGYKFRIVDDLITNFHLPRSTLIVLVAAAMGIEDMQKAYQHALMHAYRFFSYGDAMLIKGR